MYLAGITVFVFTAMWTIIALRYVAQESKPANKLAGTVFGVLFALSAFYSLTSAVMLA